MNNNKEINMINLKKVGLTALAGSLAAVTAQAGELSVTGSANVTYVTKSGDNTAQSLGNDKDVKFSGSGELDNGWTFAIHTLTKDDFTISSTATVMTMGSLGSIGVGSGGGTNVNGAYDEPIPTAYEENSDAGGQSPSNYVGSIADDNAIIYTSPSYDLMGMSINYGVEYAIDADTATGKDGAVAADGPTYDEAIGVGVTASVAGLTFGAYASEATRNNPGGGAAISGEFRDNFSGAAFVNYSFGPVSVGYRISEIQSGAASASGKNVEAYAIAFNVNDNMSVSLATQDIEFDVPSGTNTTETIDAINASYTMGAASVRATMSEATDDAGVAGSDDEHMEISLVLSF